MENTAPASESVFFTHLGTATVLIEIGDIRILTDPTFDQPGKDYNFGWGLGSTKTNKVVIPPKELGKIDIVLLSHDEHADNLDEAGRALLPDVQHVLTTLSGSKRLSSSPSNLKNVTGLKDWEKFKYTSPSGFEIEVVATPARHGPPLSSIIVGDVIGFVLTWKGQKNGSLYITGDTVLYGDLYEIPKRFKIGTLIVHLGGVQFAMSFGIHYTLTAEDASLLIKSMTDLKTVIPVHYEGWTHFKESKETSIEAFRKSKIEEKITWTNIGDKIKLDV